MNALIDSDSPIVPGGTMQFSNGNGGIDGFRKDYKAITLWLVGLPVRHNIALLQKDMAR